MPDKGKTSGRLLVAKETTNKSNKQSCVAWKMDKVHEPGIPISSAVSLENREEEFSSQELGDSNLYVHEL
jgi:hypothetical protein